MKTRNFITKFSALKSVITLKLFLLCHSLSAEKFEFYYTFQGTEFKALNLVMKFLVFIAFSLQFSAPENPSVHPVGVARVHLIYRTLRNTEGVAPKLNHYPSEAPAL